MDGRTESVAEVSEERGEEGRGEREGGRRGREGGRERGEGEGRGRGERKRKRGRGRGRERTRTRTRTRAGEADGEEEGGGGEDRPPSVGPLCPPSVGPVGSASVGPVRPASVAPLGPLTAALPPHACPVCVRAPAHPCRARRRDASQACFVLPATADPATTPTAFPPLFFGREPPALAAERRRRYDADAAAVHAAVHVWRGGPCSELLPATDPVPCVPCVLRACARACRTIWRAWWTRRWTALCASWTARASSAILPSSRSVRPDRRRCKRPLNSQFKRRRLRPRTTDDAGPRCRCPQPPPSLRLVPRPRLDPPVRPGERTTRSRPG